MSEHSDQLDDTSARNDDAHQANTALDDGDHRPNGVTLETFWARLDPIDA